MKKNKTQWAEFDPGTQVIDDNRDERPKFTFTKKTKALLNIWKAESHWDKKDYKCKIGDIITIGGCPEMPRFIVLPGTPYNLITVSPVKKEFKTSAVKDSTWEFTDTVSLYIHITKPDPVYGKNYYEYISIERNFSKGTKLTVINNKMVIARFGLYRMLHLNVSINGEKMLIPAGELSQYIKMITAGKTKTYWRLLDKENNQVTQKRFSDLGKVKASARVRRDLVENTGPDWLDTSNPEIFNDWVAVQYDYSTDKELQREELKDWLFIQSI